LKFQPLFFIFCFSLILLPAFHLQSESQFFIVGKYEK